MSKRSTRRQLIALAAVGCGAWLGLDAARANANCAAIAAPTLEIAAVDCTAVWPQLQASGAFPDVFAGSGKTTNLCYASTGPASATLGDQPVTIESTHSGWTTDFTPVLFGGTDNLGTVVTQWTLTDLRGRSQAKLFTRDTIDLSQIASGSAPEEDVIVGGSAWLKTAKGTYRIASAPEDAQASKVKLTNLTGVLCLGH